MFVWCMPVVTERLELARGAEVGDFGVQQRRRPQHHVLRLEVAVQHALEVQQYKEGVRERRLVRTGPELAAE